MTYGKLFFIRYHLSYFRCSKPQVHIDFLLLRVESKCTIIVAFLNFRKLEILTKIVKVTAAIIVKDKRVLIAQRKSLDKLPDKWEFPGGKVEDNETPEQCLKREMKEEFGIDVSVGEFIGENVYHYDHISIRLLAYRTFWNTGEIKIKAHQKIEWVTIDQICRFDFAPADIPFVKKLRRGEIAV
jgi:8-oxo-dGTP diphosphatase